MPLSAEAQAWLGRQANTDDAYLALASGGDDYALVCAAAPESLDRFKALARKDGRAIAVVGTFGDGEGLRVAFEGRSIDPGSFGWRH